VKEKIASPAEAEERKRGSCMEREGILYCTTCMKHEEEGRVAEYWGESACSSYKIGKDQEALRRGDENSPLVKHREEHHKDEEDVEFSMAIIERQGPVYTNC